MTGLSEQRPLEAGWLRSVGEAIGKDPGDVLVLLKTWWNEGRTLSYMNSELVRLAETNGKKLVLVSSNNN